MSDEQQGQATATASAQQDGPDDREPSDERKAELRAAYEANVAAGKEPYAGAEIRTRGEVAWILRERDWSGDLDEGGKERANLSGANLGEANLSGANLFEANLSGARLVGANLSGARLFRANLSSTILVGANLSGARLDGGAHLEGARLDSVNLSGANLDSAHLEGAYLNSANLSDAYLGWANLSSAILVGARMDAATVLRRVKLNQATRLGDVVWNGVPLTQVDWGQVPRLGDEQAIKADKGRRVRIIAYRDAARAYHGLSIALRAQGLPAASYYRLREQRLERAVLLREGKLGGWLFSLLLDLVAGYGERPGRIFISYVTVVLAFAAAYFGVTHLLETQLTALTWDESLVLSLTSFHGRGFFPGFLSLGDWVARIAAIEAVIGLFIELILIATFSRRFLGN